MDQYLSTYRKDFMWPYVRTFSIRTDPQSYDSPHQSRCPCGEEPGGFMPPKEYVGPLDGDNYQWSRLGPMAPLLDPKLYPSKMGPAPEFEIMRYDQPNTYLKKLQEKYPFLYNVLQSAAPDDMIRRVNEDRLRSTYQVDYGHIDEHPSGDYEKLLAQAGISGCSKNIPCYREGPPVLDCRSHIRPPDYSESIQPGSDRFEHGPVDNSRGVENGGRAFENGAGSAREISKRENGVRSNGETGAKALKTKSNGGGNGGSRGNGGGNGVSRSNGGSGGGGGGGGSAKADAGGFDSVEGEKGKSKRTGKGASDEEDSKKPLPAWRSEYQGVIGQTGMDIIRDKMHQHGGRSKGRSFIERIIMKCRA